MSLIQNFRAQVADYALALTDISVNPGEVTLLYGPSGSGKTSFLLGLLGILPSKYNFTLESKAGSAEDLGSVPVAEKNIGVVFQFENLFDHISVYKNLLLVKDPNVTEDEFKEKLKKFNIEHLLNKRAGVLSGGEQQMVACVRVFLQRGVRLLLLDEPWSAMDPENKNNYRQHLLKYIQEKNLPCILVSHDEDEAKHLSPQYIYNFNQVARFEKGQP